MEPAPPPPRPRLHRARLAHSHLRHLPGRPPVVPNPLVYQWYRPLPPHRSPHPPNRSPHLSLPVALAWRPRRPPGYRLRNDPPADADEVPRRSDALCESVHRQCDDDRGEGECAESRRTRGSVPEFRVDT
jgi:hypothetical protein